MHVGEADDSVTRSGEVGIAGAVPLEGGAGPMAGVSVDFDDQALLRPEEVDLEAADAGVHPRPFDRTGGAEVEETLLELTPSESGAGFVTGDCLGEAAGAMVAGVSLTDAG